ncbi:MAG TPA: M1 family metallopeptidase [Polyangia bacterium]|nr:M1 family metallopeptidase [Polyangia bacterium]
MSSSTKLGKNFRLPLDIRPTRYRAEVTVDMKANTFEGRLAIDVTSGRASSELQLHAVGLELSSATAEIAGRAIAAKPSVDAESETVTLSFAEPVPAGAATLRLAYRGAFSPGLRGLYRAGAIAVTQFEAADARRLFPCFDEPAFKARWEVSLSGVPAGAVALSNGIAIKDEPDGQGARRVTFAPTPVLSSYLVAAVVGELVSSDAVTVRDVAIRTWSVPAKKHLTAFAQRCAAAVLPLLEDYFGLPYPFGKLDQIGVPDFEAGAMENAGCITFREVALLLDEATAPLAVQKRVAEVITHELAHQWFGNLVTMVWWDDLWLNEAFATWMAYKIVDRWRPEWRIWMDFEGGKGGAMLLDSLQAAHPIRAEIANAEEAGESFDAITYEKGGAVLRMIEGFLGEDKFRDGIRLYMRKHREANATADDLWAALGEASGQPYIVQLANGWIRQVGYPVIQMSLDAKTNTVALSQRRFFADPGAREAGAPTTWLVPIVLRFRDARGVHEQAVLLDARDKTIRLEAEGEVKWVFGNADARGFFRAAYDGPLLAKLLPALGELRPSERMALVSDQWALVRAGVVSISAFLDLVAGLGGEEDHVVLDDLVGRLATIEHRHIGDDATRARFQAFVRGLVGSRAAKLAWGPASAGAEDDETRLCRAALLRALVLLAREPAAVAEAARRLPPTGAPNVDPNLLDIVVTAAAREADAKRFEELRVRAREEADPAAKRRYLHALARVEAPALAERAVALSLEADVPMQDFTSFLGVLLGNPATRESAWKLVHTRFDEVRAKADSPMLLRRLVEALAALPERRHLEEITAFLAAHPIDGAKQATAQTLERLRMDVALRERLVPEVARWLQARPAQ